MAPNHYPCKKNIFKIFTYPRFDFNGFCSNHEEQTETLMDSPFFYSMELPMKGIFSKTSFNMLVEG